MELVVYREDFERAQRNSSAGEAFVFVEEEIRSSYLSGDDGDDGVYDDPLYADKEHRYSLSVWLEHMEDEIDDVAELPPVYVVKYPDLIERALGWQRLVPFVPGCVEWPPYKEYLKEYCRQNDGEIAALCANKKPEKDKSYFVRRTALRGNKKPDQDEEQRIAFDRRVLRAAARQCIDVEHDYRWGFMDAHTAEERSLSKKIEEFADRVIKSAGESSAAVAAGLLCIAKETGLLFELLEARDVYTTDMIRLSKKVRRPALNLMLHQGPEPVVAIAAMVGMAKEAKYVLYLLSREDRQVGRDYSLCHMIREYTEKVFAKLLEGFACENPVNSDGRNGTPASAKSEETMGYGPNN